MKANQCTFFTACRLQQKAAQDNDSREGCWPNAVNCNDQMDMDQRCRLFSPVRHAAVVLGTTKDLAENELYRRICVFPDKY